MPYEIEEHRRRGEIRPAVVVVVVHGVLASDSTPAASRVERAGDDDGGSRER